MAKKILYSAIGVVALIFISLFIIGSNTPQPQKTAAVEQPQPVATTSVVALDTQKVSATLSASANYYSKLFATAKTTLGTTQYPNASAGLSALNNPNSTASKFGSFRTETCLKNDPSANAMDAYRTVSDMYSFAQVKSPSALDDWNYDTNTVASDICEWASTAADWQISKVTSAQLKTAEQKVTADLTKAQEDLSQITH